MEVLPVMRCKDGCRKERRMNHDYSHCLDFNDSCPKKCFRAELVRDLRSRKDMVGVPISWTHYKGTDECPKVERKEL